MTAQQSGREAFEAWYAANDNTRKSIERDATGYRLIQTEAAWQAWDAAWQAALAQQGREVGEAWGEKLPPFARTHEGQKVYSLAYSRGRKKGREETAAPNQQAVDEVMLSHIAAVIDGTLAHCISDSTTEERMYVGEQCLNELANIRAALLAALAGKTEVDRG